MVATDALFCTSVVPLDVSAFSAGIDHRFSRKVGAKYIHG
jgi:hypothetical protein